MKEKTNEFLGYGEHWLEWMLVRKAKIVPIGRLYERSLYSMWADDHMCFDRSIGHCRIWSQSCFAHETSCESGLYQQDC